MISEEDEITDVTFPVLTASNELYVIATTNSQTRDRFSGLPLFEHPQIFGTTEVKVLDTVTRRLDDTLVSWIRVIGMKNSGNGAVSAELLHRTVWVGYYDYNR